MTGGFWGRVDELGSLQWRSTAELEQRQFHKLKNLVKYAYSNVQLYNTKFREARIHPDDIKTIQDFASLPIVTKEELRAVFPGQVVARSIKPSRLATRYSSGSTSTPFQFYLDLGSMNERRASTWLFNSWFGYAPGKRRLYIGNVRRKSLRDRIKDRVVRNNEIAVAKISYRNAAKVITDIDKMKPYHIEGFPSSLALLVCSMLENRLQLRCKLGAVVSVSERLLESQREYIESAFKCPVIERYGLVELGGIVAQQCRNDSWLHVNTELCILEVVDDNGRPGSEGQTGCH